ncbi:MAG TPA: flagellar assembly protein FliW [Anaerolineales bacterium]|nr:flagellar assembly protein FliW [Anaerolineales bacterium]
MDKKTLALEFPAGLVGCPEWRRFRLTQDPDAAPIALLESLDEPNLSFLVVDPRLWVPGYTLQSAAEALAAAGLPDLIALTPLAILNVHAEPLQVTANLLGPLAVDFATGKGAQVILTDQPYSADQPVTLLEERIHLPEGLIGCPDWRGFLLRRAEELRPVKLLVSLELPGLSLPVVHPDLIAPGYRPKVSEEDAAMLGLNNASDLDWLVLLTITNEPVKVTANLLGPIAFNKRTGVARQIVQSGAGYPVAQPVGLFTEPAAAEPAVTVGVHAEVRHARAHA